MGRVFGDLSQFEGSANDLYALATRTARLRTIPPRLFQCCGTEDFLYAGNLRFKAHAEALGLPLTYEEGPGEHVWAYWDTMIQRVLAWLPLRTVEAG